MTSWLIHEINHAIFNIVNAYLFYCGVVFAFVQWDVAKCPIQWINSIWTYDYIVPIQLILLVKSSIESVMFDRLNSRLGIVCVIVTQGWAGVALVITVHAVDSLTCRCHCRLWSGVRFAGSTRAIVALVSVGVLEYVGCPCLAVCTTLVTAGGSSPCYWVVFIRAVWDRQEIVTMGLPE